MSGVRFWKGDAVDFNSIQKEDDVLYFIMDEFKIFLGDKEITNNNTLAINQFVEDIADSEISASWGEVK